MHYANAGFRNTTESNKKYWEQVVWEMAAAYAAFANGGIYHKPMYINNVFYDGSPKNTLIHIKAWKRRPPIW